MGVGEGVTSALDGVPVGADVGDAVRFELGVDEGIDDGNGDVGVQDG